MISHRHHCVFTHVPKTAGKSVLAVFGLPMLARDYDGHLHYIEDAHGHQPLSSLRDRPAFAYFKFAFVRNPWDRLVSAFHYLDRGGCNALDQAFRDAHLARYARDFTAFVHDLDRHMDGLHLRPQCHWLCDDEGRVLADFVGRFETLTADFGVVAARLELPRVLPCLNTSEHRFYREYYDPDTCAIVHRLYRQDIEAFRYQF